jgi:hypothetical protein
MKTLIMTGMVFGTYAGSYLPMLWGGSVFSMTSILWGGIGGFAGIWMGYKLANRIGLG